MFYNKIHFRKSVLPLAQLVRKEGALVGSRIGATREVSNAIIELAPGEILYRPGMVRRLGIVEILQFVSGYFDERHILKAVPGLQYPYGIQNAYGQRVSQQLPRVLQQLKETPGSRRATLYIGKPEDVGEKEKPCMQMAQFQIRNEMLLTTVYARSWDVLSGLPYDIIMFQGVTAILANILGLRPGPVTFMVGSLHVYEEAWERAEKKYGNGEDVKWTRLRFTRGFSCLEEARNWAMDELNEMDNWVHGLPHGIEVTK